MKNFLKFKKHFMYVLVVVCPLLLGGAKYWQDPNALSETRNCANGACCADCVETMDTPVHRSMEGWQWRMQIASHYYR